MLYLFLNFWLINYLFSCNFLSDITVFTLAIVFLTSFIFLGFSNPFVASAKFNLNNSFFNSTTSFSNSSVDISLLLFIFIHFTTFNKFCFYR